MALRLMQTSTVVFQRYDPSAMGYYDDEANYVSGGWMPITTEGSLQPYLKGTTQLTLPEGNRAEEALIYFTGTEIKTVDQFGKTEADRATIDGYTYVAHATANWSRFTGLRINHYQVLLTREDQNTNGSI